MTLRALAASFNAIAMVAYTFALTGGSFADRYANVAVWGSAAAAVVAALTVLAPLPAVLGWAAIGYVLFAATWGASVGLVPILLAAAFVPLVPRPRGSALLGVAVALATAIVLRFVVLGAGPAG